MEPCFLSIPFRGNRSGNSPLTWGQCWIWNLVASRAPHYADLGDSYTVVVPDMCDMNQVSSALAALLNRYETFRSRFQVSADGKPHQLILAEGHLRTEVRDVAADDARSAAGTVEAEFNSVPFTLPELSLRAAVISSDGVPKYVVLCAFHMAMDCHGMVSVLDDFRSFLSGHPVNAEESVPSHITHPLDRARMEGEANSARRSARGIQFWEQELAKFPDDPLPYIGHRPESPRYKMFSMRSAAVRAASLEIAAELGVSTASVIHAMAATLVAKRTGSQKCGFVMAASHRFDADSTSYAGTLVQGVPVAVDVADCKPQKIISQTHRAGMLAALAGYCDPHDLYDVLRKSYSPEETRARLACVVNLHLPDPAGATGQPTAGTGVTRAQAERLLTESRYDYVEGTTVENERFYLAAQGDSTDFFITLRADTAALTSTDIAGFLRELERALIGCLPQSATATSGLPRNGA
ncbi:condensation domain-containing protein [Micromonospora sp. NPDC053740]|uniref:condensation domain-containing protein n=1 Tax=Micromonospora sp. NPDC053740 TaxID=3155173 RepID=UPI00341E6ED7